MKIAPRPFTLLSLGLLALAAHAQAGSQTAPEAISTTGRYLVRVAPFAAESSAIARQAADWEARGARVRHVFAGLGAWAIEASPDAAKRLAELPGVMAVEPDPIRVVTGLREKQLVPSTTNALYGLVTARFTAARAAGFLAEGFVVGVGDTGLDCGHPDIAGALLSSVDATGHGGSCLGQAGVDPGEQHATHVAGTILALDNKIGVFGGASRAKLRHARVCSGVPGSCFGSDVMEGVRALVDAGARIVNLSLGGPGSSAVEQDFFRGLRQQGILVIASSGNDDGAPVSFPAAYDGVVAVGAVDNVDAVASFSNVGAALDLVAPGVSVLSTLPRGTGRDPSVEAPKKVVFGAADMGFAPLTPKAGVKRKLVFCGLGNVGECPASVKNQIALVARGEIFFSQKVANAMAQKAAAVVIFNNAPGLFSGTLQTANSPSGKPWVPVVAVAAETGAELKAKSLGKLVTVFSVVSDYGTFSGTSMAAPHVAAAAALVWAAHPELDAAGVEQRLKATAVDLGAPGFDNTFGFGRIDAAAAVQ
jgi:serine protease